MFEASRRAVLDLATTVRRLGIKADVYTHDALRILSPYSPDEKAFAREVHARRDAGLDAVLLKGAAASREAGIERVPAGVRFHDWGQGDPYRLAIGFAQGGGRSRRVDLRAVASSAGSNPSAAASRSIPRVVCSRRRP